MTQQSKFTFNPEGWKIKTEYRSKNRMKFQLKLNQEEAEAFRNFANTVKPEELGMEDFVRSIFFNGVRSLEEQLTNNLVQHMEENRADYEASGFTFDASGKLTGVDEATASGAIEVLD
jgi:hypothetical protein|tara:strand:+ start:153 stop:506 length:354 start_codon:yes stop_codon:yes gene_type:complete